MKSLRTLLLSHVPIFLPHLDRSKCILNAPYERDIGIERSITVNREFFENDTNDRDSI